MDERNLKSLERGVEVFPSNPKDKLRDVLCGLSSVEEEEDDVKTSLFTQGIG